MDPGAQDIKEEWLEGLSLCSLSPMPDELKAIEPPVDSDSEEEDLVEEVVVDEDVKLFDAFGRRRGDKNFGVGDPDFAEEQKTDKAGADKAAGDDKAAGADSSSEEDSDSSESDDEDADMDKELLSGWMGAEIQRQKKHKSSSRQWFILTPRGLAIHDGPLKAHALKSSIPLSVCMVRERPKSKRKKQPHAFRIDISNMRLCAPTPVAHVSAHPNLSLPVHLIAA